MNKTRRHIVLGAMASPIAAHLGPAWANTSDWPTKPVRLLVPGSPGSGSDTFARLIGGHLSTAIGQPVVIDNKPGANGTIASDMTAKADPDGYTFLFSNGSSIVVNVALGKKLPYAPEDLQAVAQISSGGVLLVASAKTGATDIDSFAKYLRANPDLPYGTWGIGSTGHIAMEWIAARQGLKVRHVPYKSVPQIVNDLRAGLIELAFLDARFSAIPLVQSGHINPIAVTGTSRSTAFPDVPTLTEQGMTMNADGWYGMFTTRGVPKPIVDRVNKEVLQILSGAETSDHLRKQHIVAPPLKSADAFEETIRNDVRIWKELIETASLKV